MSLSPRFGRFAAALSLVLTASFAEAGPYSSMYVFGDSLSDGGNVLSISEAAFGAGNGVPQQTYYTDGINTGRFTNGLNYADRVAQGLGLSLTPSTQGGNNYAYGGARSDYVRPDVAAIGGLSFIDQINQYAGLGAPADPNALYVLWIGSNDVSDGIGQSLGQGGNPAPIMASIQNAVTNLVTGLLTLEFMGARHFAIGNVGDLGLTPRVNDLVAFYGNPDIAALATGASMGFNAALASTVPNFVIPGADVAMIDAFGIQQAVTHNPGAFGLSNVTEACYNGEVDGSSLPVPGGTPTVCAHPEQYAYFDYEHPSAALHAIFADRLLAQLVPEPTALSLVFAGLGMLGCMSRRRRHV